MDWSQETAHFLFSGLHNTIHLLWMCRKKGWIMPRKNPTSLNTILIFARNYNLTLVEAVISLLSSLLRFPDKQEQPKGSNDKTSRVPWLKLWKHWVWSLWPTPEDDVPPLTPPHWSGHIHPDSSFPLPVVLFRGQVYRINTVLVPAVQQSESITHTPEPPPSWSSRSLPRPTYI